MSILLSVSLSLSDEEYHISIMRPNTPHIIFTLEHSVCLGGHYYGTSTLRDTCYGIMHSFAAGSVVTNTSHVKESFMVLACMVILYHTQLTLANQSDDEMDIDLGTFLGIFQL